MSFKEIRELIDVIDKSQISLMELNYDKIYLKLDKSINRQESVTIKRLDKNYKEDLKDVVNLKNNNLKNDNDVINVENVSSEVEDDAQYIVSPMVGTVYLAPAPDKKPYVSKGNDIKNGDVVCIVEAMKLMNEIESEFSGKIAEVLVNNGQMVEYGQKLFKIKKS